jgi:hypothetical protein
MLRCVYGHSTSEVPTHGGCQNIRNDKVRLHIVQTERNSVLTLVPAHKNSASQLTTHSVKLIGVSLASDLSDICKYQGEKLCLVEFICNLIVLRVWCLNYEKEGNYCMHYAQRRSE